MSGKVPFEFPFPALSQPQCYYYPELDVKLLYDGSDFDFDGEKFDIQKGDDIMTHIDHDEHETFEDLFDGTNTGVFVDVGASKIKLIMESTKNLDRLKRIDSDTDTLPVEIPVKL